MKQNFNEFLEQTWIVVVITNLDKNEFNYFGDIL